jgi:uncharacterized protein DUF3106
MKLRLQFGGWLLAVASIAGMVLPCAAQKRDNNKPPQQPRQQQRQAPRPQQGGRRAQNVRPSNDRPHNNVAPNRLPPSRETESMGMIGGNRPPNARESGQRPDFNPNRPPNASSQARNLSPQERQKLQQDERRFRQFPPQQQQEMRDRARVWGKLTPEQQNHIKGDILPKWQQMSSQRQKAVRQRLGVLQNMPESARNQHLNDPNFTRGMSEEDKAMLRDLSHMHVGAPDPPNE